jgi:hypothetical protein
MTTTRTGLPKALKQGIEDLSGLSMSDVRVHQGSEEPAQVQAAALAQGQEIHVAPGQDEPPPHEAWHVVQQGQGRVSAAASVGAETAVNDDPGLEREADQMGAAAVRAGDTDRAGDEAADAGAAPDKATETAPPHFGNLLPRVGAALGGTVRVAAGVKLDAPTGEAWEAET